jgi:hypothetical protein
VAAYNFDEGSGTVVYDASGNGNNGTALSTTWTSGKYGEALNFNGTTSNVWISDAPILHLTNAMTLEAWVYPTSTTARYRDVIYKGVDNYYVEATSPQAGAPVTGGTFTSELFGTSALPVNTWSYLAATYDRSTLRLYVNGVQVASKSATAAIAVSSNPLRIGGNTTYGSYYNGVIDDVRIYNRALTQAEIQNDMNTPVVGTVPTPTPTATATPTPTPTPAPAADDFNRADGGLGPDWADLPEGGVAIVSGQVVGTHGGSSSGSYWVGTSYNNDQYSEITVTSSPLSVWIGASVRNQGNGNLYVGIYYANGGVPQLRLYKRVVGFWTQLGASYNCGTLAAGTKLRLVVVGGTLAFLQDGVERIAVYDGDIAGGAPGVMIWGTDALDDWTGGNAGFEVNYLSTDADGIESYHTMSRCNGYGPHVLRVLRPDNPTPGVTHNVLYVLPVEPEGSTVFGDGLRTLRELNIQNQYNVTLIAPSFPIDPWYADHPADSNYKFESFMSLELQPWVTANLESTGSEQHWLLGFSKSGFGGIDLLLKHPDLFTLGAFWDFPATGFTTFDQFGPSSASNYGTDANFQANYRLTPAFVQTYKNPFLTDRRIWIWGYQAFQQDVADFDTLLTVTGIAHTFPSPEPTPDHTWDSGWVPQAVAGLYQNSIDLANPVGPARLPGKRRGDGVAKAATNSAKTNLHKRMRVESHHRGHRHFPGNPAIRRTTRLLAD